MIESRIFAKIFLSGEIRTTIWGVGGTGRNISGWVYTLTPPRVRLAGTFSLSQEEALNVLEDSFAVDYNPLPCMFDDLAQATGKTVNQVDLWFQGRRRTENNVSDDYPTSSPVDFDSPASKGSAHGAGAGAGAKFSLHTKHIGRRRLHTRSWSWL